VFDSWVHHLTEQEFAEFAEVRIAYSIVTLYRLLLCCYQPYASVIMHFINSYHPEVPMTYFANGGSAFLSRVKNVASLQSLVAESDNVAGCCRSVEGQSSKELLDDRNCSPEDSNCCRLGSGSCMRSEQNSIFLDQRVDMLSARAILGPERTLLGNIDPLTLLYAPAGTQIIADEVKKCFTDGRGVAIGGKPGRHVMNVGHGIEQGTPEENVQAFVNAAKDCIY
jgi:uroporphyrinogen-III decarboxylase